MCHVSTVKVFCKFVTYSYTALYVYNSVVSRVSWVGWCRTTPELPSRVRGARVERPSFLEAAQALRYVTPCLCGSSDCFRISNRCPALPTTVVSKPGGKWQYSLIARLPSDYAADRLKLARRPRFLSRIFFCNTLFRF